MVEVPDGWEQIESSDKEVPVGEREEHIEKYRRDDGAEVDILEVEKEKSGDWGYLVRAEPTPAFDDVEEPDLGTDDDLDAARDRAAEFLADHPV